MRTILFRNQRPNVIGPYTMKTGDIIYLWNGKVGVNAQTLPFPFALKFLNNSKVCTQATFVWLLWRSCRFNYLGFTKLHSSCFNLEFENRWGKSDTWLLIYGRKKGKISGCFKNSTSVVLQQCSPAKFIFRERVLAL